MKLVTTIGGLPPEGCAHPGAVALGYFDGVHLGHRSVLAGAASCREAGMTPTAFTFSLAGENRTPRSKTGGRLYQDDQRAQLLFDCGMDVVVMPKFHELADLSDREYAALLCGRLGAKAVFCGEDYRFGRGASAGADRLRELCAAYGVPVTAAPAVYEDGERVSSTRIRALLRAGDVAEAGRLLGRPYEIDTVVETGQQLGRRLGFPTINQPLFPGAVEPLYGVYATRVYLAGRAYPGVTSVGVRPTVGEHLAPRAETYIMDFSGDLYGCRIRVEFIALLRGEIRFDSLDALKHQIEADSRRARIEFLMKE